MRTVILTVWLGLLVACGDDPSDSDANLDLDQDHDNGSDEAKGDSPADAAIRGEDCDFTISLLDYKLEPADVTARPGMATVCARNAGKAPHDLAVRDGAKKDLGRTKVLSPGESDRFELRIEAGKFDIYCTQAGHESLGMRGTLTIE